MSSTPLQRVYDRKLQPALDNVEDGHRHGVGMDAQGLDQGLYDLDGGPGGPAIIRKALPPREVAEQMYLVDFPRNEIVVTCQTCGRGLQLRTHRLIAEHGRREKIVDVLAAVSRTSTGCADNQCELTLATEGV